MVSSTPGWLKKGAAHVWRPYCQHQTARPPLAVVGAHGSRLVLADGQELVDGIASWWTAAHGYNHPHIRASVEAQLQTLPHVALGGLAHEAAYTLASRLASWLKPPLSRVFFAESGSVAVEVALKMALQSFANRGQSRKHLIVAFDGAYHGDTFATMALADPTDGMHRAFDRVVDNVLHLPLPIDDDDSFERLLRLRGDEIAAVIVEPLVQCAGGMRFFPTDVLRRLRAGCDAHDCLLVFDEIATGFFRTGARFAMERAGVVPDIVTIGKALTGGTLPLAAAVASERVFEAFFSAEPAAALQHGPTYMGNALACAAAHASLDLFEAGDTSARVAALEENLRAALMPVRGARNVQAVRVLGGIGVVEMRPGTAPPSHAFAERGAFIRPIQLRHADVVYLMPPLVIDARDIVVLGSAIAGALAS